MIPLRVVPLGGLTEIGMNMMLLECGDDSIIVDCGLSFPNESTPGVDLLVPNFEYALTRRASIRALFLTHAHEDHIGATPFLLRHLNLPVYGTRFTLLMLRRRWEEFGGKPDEAFLEMAFDEPVTVGGFRVTPTAVAHSVPDSVALVIDCDAGRVIHTGDFKVDHTPVAGAPANLTVLAAYASSGVLLLLSDSTGAVTGGTTPSERAVSPGLEEVIRSGAQRIIVTAISSHVHRLQQLFDMAAKHGRRVEVIGRSLRSTVELAERHGYLKRALPRHSAERTLVLVTGSQGEDRAALARIARGENRDVVIGEGDVIVFSARTIPGNEMSVGRVIDRLYRLGATVVDNNTGAHVHVSGHAAQDDLRLMLRLVQPKFFIPIHGTVRHLHEHARLAAECGVDPAKIHIALNGDKIEIDGDVICHAGTVPAGKQFVTHTSGTLTEAALSDRLRLADAGFVVIIIRLNDGRRYLQPSTVVTRGLLHVDTNRELLCKAAARVDTLVERLIDDGADREMMRDEIRTEIAHALSISFETTPLIIPVFLEM
ncbi:MAG: ribonuclease [Acidobacteriota bacterium]|jgi:ribonuclease J|nr:ribonuclease [Acidobacteriota bacterium]